MADNEININVLEKLESLEEVEREVAEYTAKTKQDIADAIPEEIANRIHWLEKQLIDFLEPLSILRDQLEKEITADVLASGESVKGRPNYQAVYYKGKTTWDGKALAGFALAHPEIDAMKRTGQPSVRIKR